MALPNNLQQLRKRANLSQEALAELLHITRQAVSKWESGQSVPDADTCVKLCELLGVTPNQLLLGEDSAETHQSANSPRRSDYGVLSVFLTATLFCGTVLMICNLCNPHYFEPNIHILSLLMICGSIIAFGCATFIRILKRKRKKPCYDK